MKESQAKKIALLNGEGRQKQIASNNRALQKGLEADWLWCREREIKAENRHLFHLAHLKELNESLTESAEELTFDVYEPLDAQGNQKDFIYLRGVGRAMIEYFYAAIRANSRNKYLTQYNQIELAGFRLFKARGINAGFAIKPGGEITAVHNNSNVRNIIDQLSKAAIASGGDHLDHYDGLLHEKYDDRFEIVRRDKWDDSFPPEAWDYAPINIYQSSHHGGITKNPDAYEERYQAGKPDIVYRKLRKLK